MEYLSNHLSDFTQIQDLSLGYQTKLYKCFKPRRPQTEEDLKTFKVEYLCNYWSVLTQIWDLCLGYKIKLYKCFKLTRPQKENDIKIYKVKYLSNHLSDHPQIRDLSLAKIYKRIKLRPPQMEVKMNYLNNQWLDLTQT